MDYYQYFALKVPSSHKVISKLFLIMYENVHKKLKCIEMHQ